MLATLVLSFGLHLSFGVYEVVWSLYLIALGATVAWVGLSFVVFAIPEMIAAPVAGRWVDRKGPIPFIVICCVAIMLAGIGYALVRDYVAATLIVPFESLATAAMGPALFTMLARGTPRGRASTAQGLYGAVTTSAFIVASIAAGGLFEQGIDLPFWFFVIGIGHQPRAGPPHLPRRARGERVRATGGGDLTAARARRPAAAACPASLVLAVGGAPRRVGPRWLPARPPS